MINLSEKMEAIFMLIGGLGIFLYGIKSMGESLKAYAGDDLRDLINKYTSTPLKGVLVGAMSTVAIQSSSGTTALVVSLVRAGLMDLRQAIGVIMGANIGTTVTAFLLGLKIKEYALPIMFVGSLIFMFSTKRKKVLIGQIIFGFGALFYGMDLMETPLKALSETSAFSGIMQSVATTPLLGILIGTLLTLVVQSSSATVGILQGLFASGALSFPVAISILLGDNIGTTVTAALSSMGGNKDSKRAALSHLIFNLFGSIVFFIIFYVFGGIILLEKTVNFLNLNLELQIAFSHLIFNVSVTMMLIWFVKQIEYIVTRIIPKTKEEFKIDVNEHFLDENLIYESPSLALEQGKNALLMMGETTICQMEESIKYIKNKKKSNYEMVLQYEMGINAIDKKLQHFFTELSGTELSEENIKSLNTYMYSISEYERIADLSEKLVIQLNQRFEDKEYLTEDAEAEILKMYKIVYSCLKKTIELFKTDDLTIVGVILEREKKILKIERKNYKNHLKRVQEGLCKGKISIVYVDMISDIERMGDNVKNIVEYYTNVNQILTEEEEDFDLSDIVL